MRKIAIILLFLINLTHAGKGVFFTIQNATNQEFSIKLQTPIDCYIIDPDISNQNITAFSVKQFYLENKCFLKTVTGIINLINKKDESIAFSINYSIQFISITNFNVTTNNFYAKVNYEKIENPFKQDRFVIDIIPNENLSYYESWMENNYQDIENKQLNQIVLPGTHDSLTNSLSSWDICQYDPYKTDFAVLGKDFAIAQSLSFMEQVRRGIRYFDIRLCWKDEKNNGRIFTTHSLLSNQSFEEQLFGLSEFLKNHPKELIILNLNQVFLSKNNQEIESARLNLLYDYLTKEFESYIASYLEFLPTSKILEFSNKNKNLIIIGNTINMPKWVWPSYLTYSSTWSEDIYKQEYKNILIFVEQQIKIRDFNKLFIAQLQFTPDANFIINNVLVKMG